MSGLDLEHADDWNLQRDFSADDYNLPVTVVDPASLNTSGGIVLQLVEQAARAKIPNTRVELPLELVQGLPLYLRTLLSGPEFANGVDHHFLLGLLPQDNSTTSDPKTAQSINALRSIALEADELHRLTLTNRSNIVKSLLSDGLTILRVMHNHRSGKVDPEKAKGIINGFVPNPYPEHPRLSVGVLPSLIANARYIGIDLPGNAPDDNFIDRRLIDALSNHINGVLGGNEQLITDEVDKDKIIKEIMSLAVIRGSRSKADSSGTVHNFINKDVIKRRVKYYKDQVEYIANSGLNQSIINQQLTEIDAEIDNDIALALESLMQTRRYVVETVEVDPKLPGYIERYRPLVQSSEERVSGYVVYENNAKALETEAQLEADVQLVDAEEFLGIESLDSINPEKVNQQVRLENIVNDVLKDNEIAQAVAHMYIAAVHPVSIERIIFDCFPEHVYYIASEYNGNNKQWALDEWEKLETIAREAMDIVTPLIEEVALLEDVENLDPKNEFISLLDKTVYATEDERDAAHNLLSLILSIKGKNSISGYILADGAENFDLFRDQLNRRGTYAYNHNKNSKSYDEETDDSNIAEYYQGVGLIEFDEVQIRNMSFFLSHPDKIDECLELLHWYSEGNPKARVQKLKTKGDPLYSLMRVKRKSGGNKIRLFFIRGEGRTKLISIQWKDGNTYDEKRMSNLKARGIRALQDN